MDTRSPLNQCIALTLAGILFLDPIVTVAAELAVDRAAGGNTQLGQAGNGVPIVNIATPNGSGLSHNKFRDYNVGQQGLILNNATNKTQATQLGGIIVGNSNLQGRAASTILNEVTGGTRSQLKGYTEVAGQSARVIVANPHGITCDGCGFINTPRATLTTGKPVVEGGRLQRFEVDGGDIAIEGAGLNAGNIDQFELITRSARLNAELHARNLTVVTGRNDVQADSLAATPRAADGSAKPELAIDSSALGGMYAGAIRLVGTEAGVGVKLAGDMAASAGDIHIDANGRLTLAQTSARGDLQVNAQSAELTGKTYAGGGANITTREDLTNRQSLAAREGVRLDSGGLLSNQGVIEAGVNPDNSRNAASDLQVQARDLRNSGSLVAGRNLELSASQTLDNRGGTLSAQGQAKVAAAKLDNRGGRVLAKGDLELAAGELNNGEAGLVASTGKLEAKLGHLDNRGGELSSQTSANLQADSLDNRGGKLGASRQVQVTAGTLDNRSGQLTSGSTLDLQAGLVDNRDAGRIASDGKLSASVTALDQGNGGQLYSNSGLGLDLNGGKLDNRGGLLNAPGQLLLKNLGEVDNRGGEISSRQAFTLAARSLDNSGGKLLSAQALTLRIDRALNNLKGLISASALDARSTSLNNASGLLSSAGNLLLNVTGDAGNRGGEISAGGAIGLSAASLDNQGGDLLGDGGLELSLAGALNNQGGTLGSGKQLNLQAGSLDNRQGSLVADGALNARVSGLLDNQDRGSLLAKGGLAVRADRLDNRGGELGSQGRVELAGSQLDNRAGLISAGGPLVLAVEHLDNRQQGRITSAASLDYQGQRLDNQGGLVTSAGALSLKAEDVNNAQGRIASQHNLTATLGRLAQQGGELVAQGDLQLQAASLDNRQGGLVGSTKALKLAVGDVDNRGGELSSQTSVSLTGQRLDNSGGKVLAGSSLALAVARVINQAKGLVFGRQSTIVNASHLDNSGGTLAGATSLVIALTPRDAELDGTLVNRQGLLSSEGSLDLSAGHVDNQGGMLSSAADLNLTARGQLDNQGGVIVSDGALKLASAGLDNSLSGSLSAKGNLQLDTGALDNSQGGRLTAAGRLQLIAGLVDNSAKGRIASGQALSARVTGLDQHDGGELFSRADLQLDLQHGLLNNSAGGLINSPGQLLLQNLGQVQNRGGEISSQQGFTLAAQQLDNSGGKLLSNQALVVRIAQALDNARGELSANGLDLRAGSLDNREGRINSLGSSTIAVVGHFDNRGGALSANGPLDLAVATLDNRAGEIVGRGDVQARVGSLDQRGGLLIALGSLALDGQRLDNSANGLVSATRDLVLKVDEIDNRGGEISSQESVQLTGQQLDNSDQGRLLAGTRLGLAVAQVINRTRGLISGNSAVTLRATSLDNSGGRLLSQQDVDIALEQALTNTQGLINSEGRLDLSVGQLDNRSGRLSSAGAMTLASRGELNNDAGQLLTDGRLVLASASLSNREGVLSAKGAAQLTTGRLDNSQGQLIGADTLALQAGELINNAGRIGSNRALTASASRLEQRAGQLFSDTDLSLDLQGGDLDNRQGLINAPGQLLLKNLGNLDNQGGEISSQQAFTLAARSVDNASGKLLSAQALTLRIEQALANLKGLIAGSRLDVRASSLANGGGTLTSRGDTRVDTTGDLVNDDQGLINAAQRLTLNAGNLDNRGGSLLAGTALELQAQAIDNRDQGLINSQGTLDLQAGTLDSSDDGEVSAKGSMLLGLDRLIQRQGRLIGASGINLDLKGGDLDNQGGLILTQGPLSISRLRDLANQAGEISSSQGFSLSLRNLDNSGGRLISSGQLGLSGVALNNQGGLLSGWQGLAVSGQSLDNRNLGTLSSRSGDLSVTLTGGLLNSGEGAIASQGRLDVKAASLDNSGKGILSSGGDQQLDIATVLNNGAGGLIDSAAALDLKAANLNNAGGSLQAERVLDLRTTDLDNGGGSIAGNGAINLNLLGTFGNANGQLASAGPLVLQAIQIDNQAGQIASRSLLTLLTGGLDNRNRGTLAANGALLLTATGALQNDNDGLIYSRDAGIRINAANLGNAQGTIQAQGELDIDTGTFSNQGGRILSQAGNLTINAGNLDNRGGTLASLQGWVKARLGGWLDNSATAGTAGVVQGRSLELDATAIRNQGGHLSAIGGDAVLRTGDLANDQGGLYAKGLLKITGNNLNNAGQIAAQAVDFSLAGALNNQRGIIESDTTLLLAAASLDNRGGQLRGLGTTGRSQLTVRGLLDNRDGTLEIASSDFGLTAASFQNEAGRLLHVGRGVFDLTLPSVVNAGGSIVTRGGLTLNAGSWTNSSIIQAGRLTVNVGEFHQTASGQLLASDAFSGIGGSWTNDGLIASDGRLDLRLSGTYSGEGSVSSLDDLTLDAARLLLPTAGRITGGGDTRIRVGGPLDNHGVMTSASGLILEAARLNNHGTLGSAGTLRLVAANLLNQDGLIFSGGDMALRVGSFTNRYADVYSLGDIDIAADDAGGQASLLSNQSGTLESVGAFSLRAALIENRRDILTYSDGGLYTAKIEENFCVEPGVDCSGRSNTWFRITTRSKLEVTDASAAAVINAGQGLTITGGTLRNESSLISAGGDIAMTLDALDNKGVEVGETETSRVYRLTRMDRRYQLAYVAQAEAFTARYWLESPNYDAGNTAAIAPAISLFLSGEFDGEVHRLASTTQLSSGDQRYASIIQAGGNVSISARDHINNGVVRTHQTYVSGGNKVGGTASGGTGAITDFTLNAQLPPDLAQQQVNPLTLPGFSIPTGQNGLFRLSGAAGSDVDASQADQGPQSWEMAGGSIGATQRERDLSDTQARQVQTAGQGPARLGSGQLELGSRVRVEGTDAGAIRVDAGGAPDTSPLPNRTGVPGDPTQGGAIAEGPGGITSPQSQVVDRVQGLPAERAPSRSHRYLIETNPELTNLRQFLSSDYLLGELGYDPDQAQKRLGDGLYEQRLVREAIAARTGQRYLEGLTSDEAMFRYLMDNALASKERLGLSVGVSLSAAQVAALTHDIVWLEEHEVNGEKVLVPVLYLAQAEGRLAPNGALIQGRDVALISGGELDNQGTLRASNNLSASGGNLVNSGLIEAGNRLDLLATDSIRNAQGGIIAGRDVSAIALTGDIVNERSVTTHQAATQSGSQSERRDFVDTASRIEAANDLSLSAGRDLANIGGMLGAGGNASLSAGRDLIIGSATEAHSTNVDAGKARWSDTSITQHGSDVQVGGNLEIEAGRDLAVIASRVGADGDLDLAAGRDLDISSAANESHYESHYKSGGKKLDIEQSLVRQQGSVLEAGGDLSVIAGGDLSVTSSRLQAGDEAFLYAGNDLSLLAEQDSDYSLYDKQKKGSFGSSQTQRDEVTDIRHVGSSISAGGDITLVSEGDQRYQKARLESGGDLTLDSGGEIAFEAVKDLHQESHEKSKGDLAWTSAKGQGTTDETLRQSELVAQGEIAIKAVDGLKIDLKQIDQKTVSQTIDAMVQADPNLAWLKQMEERGDVDWQRVQEIHDSFKYSHSGLGVGAAIAIAILVAAATYGAASGLVGTAASATAGSGSAMSAGLATSTTTAAGITTTTSVAAGWGNVMAATALSSAAGTGASSFVSNKGDLGKTWADMTSEDSLKSYATAALIAGFAVGVTDGWGREITSEGNYKLIDYGERFKAYSANTALKLALSSDNKEAWLSIAATGALMELYQYSVGRDPDANSGVDRPEGSAFDASPGYVPKISVDGIAKEGKNIGLNLPLDDIACSKFYSVCHGTAISNLLNEVPGFNSFATIHDQWMISLEAAKGADMSVFENIGSMPPAIIVNYGAIYDKYRALLESTRRLSDDD
ncbi:filamentous hemagglutinin N-terminal domain-containing protein [Metapseudomonas resinovorans]|uniref:Putative hemolysin n=1 Tax=Metapseudomonas resinovorans NBRC 106553 TaxID=1245471 RepID=S6AXC1_METRE|nr:filamentous hemagglutinin N-terminal domain-containing protein [Pseudomonas resinovorans]BAN51063.1 putative hemolysin [Pseudomonas resinovorans NBRC 106553]